MSNPNGERTVRVGRAMRAVVAYVSRYPGCTMMEAARGALMYHGRSSNRYGYAAVNRAIAAGLIRAVERTDKRRCYRLEAV